MIGRFLFCWCLLQAAPVQGVEGPGRVGETTVVGVGFMHGLTQQHAAQLTAQGQGMALVSLKQSMPTLQRGPRRGMCFWRRW